MWTSRRCFLHSLRETYSLDEYDMNTESPWFNLRTPCVAAPLRTLRETVFVYFT